MRGETPNIVAKRSGVAQSPRAARRVEQCLLDADLGFGVERHRCSSEFSSTTTWGRPSAVVAAGGREDEARHVGASRASMSASDASRLIATCQSGCRAQAGSPTMAARCTTAFMPRARRARPRRRAVAR